MEPILWAWQNAMAALRPTSGSAVPCRTSGNALQLLGLDVFICETGIMIPTYFLGMSQVGVSGVSHALPPSSLHTLEVTADVVPSLPPSQYVNILIPSVSEWVCRWGWSLYMRSFGWVLTQHNQFPHKVGRKMYMRTQQGGTKE